MSTQVFMLDTQTGPYHVIDYVQLSGPNTVRDLTSEIITDYDAPAVSVQASGSELWNTNFQSGGPSAIGSQSDWYIAGDSYGQRRQRRLEQSSPQPAGK